MNAVILLSGGTGSRLKSDLPKQYIHVGGRMLITYALEPLLSSQYVDAVYIVAAHEWRMLILEDAERAGLAISRIKGFAEPGRNRQYSILNGLRSIPGCEDGRACAKDTVLIHDAARPLLSSRLLESCYKSFTGHDGVMPALPMKDTVYLSDGGKRVEKLLDRSRIYAGQSPELFDLKKYYHANLALMPDRILEINGSTEPALMAGMDIVMIPGEEKNFKVTTKEDLYRFQELVEKGNI